MTTPIKSFIKSNAALKAISQYLLMPPNQYRPRWWVRNFVNPFKHKKGKGAVICSRVRLDTMPYNAFELGEKALIEDFATINNAVGPVFIGDRSLVGLSSVVIGPVSIGEDVLIAQNVVISALNHNYENVYLPIKDQGVSTKAITIEDGAWIGANVVITAGVTIGKNAVVGSGSIVTKNVPDFCVVVGNPARIVKRYDFELDRWVKVSKSPIEAGTDIDFKFN